METPTLPRAGTAAVTGTMWRIDPSHSTIGFSIKHVKVATVHGHFDDFSGTIRFDGDRPWDATVEAEIDAATIETGIGKRDDHLRSADFLDAAAYPTISFRSTRVEQPTLPSRIRWLVAGDLTIHGVTRSVELAVDQTGVPGRRYADVIEFTATARINRKDFGLTWNQALEGGGLIVGDEVKITITVQANRITS